MTLKDDHSKLIRHLATLKGHKKAIKHAQGQLGDRAVKQYDSMPAVLDTVADAHSRAEGGVLTHRYHRTLLTEHSRLGAIVHPHEHLNVPKS